MNKKILKCKSHIRDKGKKNKKVNHISRIFPLRGKLHKKISSPMTRKKNNTTTTDICQFKYHWKRVKEDTVSELAEHVLNH